MKALIKYNYERLGWLTEIRSRLTDPEKIALADEAILDTKHTIRRLCKKEDPDANIISSNGDYSYIRKEILPAYIDSAEAAEEYFNENLYIEPRYSMYDCTGRHFTQWYHIGKLAGRYVAYHSIGIDI